MIYYTIAYRPCSTLHNAVFVMKKKIEELIKPVLRVADPLDDAGAVGFGMLFQYGFAEIHRDV